MHLGNAPFSRITACVFVLTTSYVSFVTVSWVCTVSNQWARYLLNYLYAVSDDGYDDDDMVSLARPDTVT